LKDKIIFYIRPFPYINTYKQMIDCAVQHGLSSIEGFCHFELETPDLEAARKVKEYADSKNVSFKCFSLFINLTGDDSKSQIEYAKKYAEIASILGAPYFHHTITPEFLEPQKVLCEKDKFLDNGILAVREIYDYAEDKGVKTIYEDQGFIFNGVNNFGEFLDKVDRDIGVVADFGNIYQSNNTLEDFISTFSSKICHVHLKDIKMTDSKICVDGLPSLTGKVINEVEIGTGMVEFEKCFKMLKDAGYNGYYALEYSAKSDDSEEIKFALKKIEKYLNKYM